MSPTARTLVYLRRSGFIADVVERWLPHANVRHDCFGFADVIAAHPQEHRVLLVQVTTSAHLSHRLAKAKFRPELRDWLRAGGEFEGHGWQQRAGRWFVRRVAVLAEDLGDVVLTVPPRRRRGERQGLLF